MDFWISYGLVNANDYMTKEMEEGRVELKRKVMRFLVMMRFEALFELLSSPLGFVNDILKLM